MRLHRAPSGVIVEAPAKLNLFFEVLGKRSDGYHEIETLVIPIDRTDWLHVRGRDDGRVTLAVRRGRGFGDPGGLGDVPEGPENLVLRAIELLRRRAGVSSGADVRLVKRIPSAAGLGGGSSDAAAALVAVNVVWELGWSWRSLAEVGAELGSDVPLFFAQGPAICRGRGEQVEPIGAPGSWQFVVVRPPEGLSTAAVYGACQPGCPPRPVDPLRRAFEQGDLRAVGRLLFNRLEHAAESLCSWIGRLRAELDAAGCLGSLMTGSGTCCFGLCGHARHARRVASRLRAKGVGIAWAVHASR